MQISTEGRKGLDWLYERERLCLGGGGGWWDSVGVSRGHIREGVRGY